MAYYYYLKTTKTIVSYGQSRPAEFHRHSITDNRQTGVIIFF